MIDAFSVGRPGKGNYFVGCERTQKKCSKPPTGVELARSVGIRISDSVVYKPYAPPPETKVTNVFLFIKEKQYFKGTITEFLLEHKDVTTRPAMLQAIRLGLKCKGWIIKENSEC